MRSIPVFQEGVWSGSPQPQIVVRGHTSDPDEEYRPRYRTIRVWFGVHRNVKDERENLDTVVVNLFGSDLKISCSMIFPLGWTSRLRRIWTNVGRLRVVLLSRVRDNLSTYGLGSTNVWTNIGSMFVFLVVRLNIWYCTRRSKFRINFNNLKPNQTKCLYRLVIFTYFLRPYKSFTLSFYFYLCNKRCLLYRLNV